MKLTWVSLKTIFLKPIKEGLRVRVGRGGGVTSGEIPRIDTMEEDDVSADDDNDLSDVCGKLCDRLLTDLLACDVQVMTIK